MLGLKLNHVSKRGHRIFQHHDDVRTWNIFCIIVSSIFAIHPIWFRDSILKLSSANPVLNAIIIILNDIILGCDLICICTFGTDSHISIQNRWYILKLYTIDTVHTLMITLGHLDVCQINIWWIARNLLQYVCVLIVSYLVFYGLTFKFSV